MRERWRRATGGHEGRDRGEGMLEYVGIVVVVALLVTTSVGAVAMFPSSASNAACRLVAALTGGDGSGCGTPDEPPVEAADDQDFHPGVCMLSETSEQYNAEVKIWFFELSESSGFIVQEFSDGTVRATLTDGAGIGAGGNIGSKTFDVGKIGDGDNAGVEVDLGGNLTFEYGSTWEFDSANQWESMRGQLDDYLIQQQQLQGQGAAGMAIYLWITDGWIEAPKDPSVTYGKIGLEAALNASAGTRIPGLGTDEDGNDELFDPKLGFEGSLTAGGAVVVETNHDTGEKAYTYELSGEVELGANVILGHATGKGAVEGAFTTTYDGDGNLAQISFKSAYEVGYDASLGNDSFTSVSGEVGEGETRSVVTTTTLDVTGENRALVEQWIDSHSTGRTFALPFSAMVPDQPSDDPFMQLMYEQAKLSQVTYHNVSDGWEFGMAVKKGWEFGFNVSAEEATATKVDAEFLGAPTQDGSRQLVDDALCN